MRVEWRKAFLVLPFFLVARLAVAAPAPTRVVDAVVKGDKAGVQALIAKRADVNLPDAQGSTPLQWAAIKDDVEITRLLIVAGATVNTANAFGVTALSIACENGNAAIVKALLDAGADANTKVAANESVLMTASRTGNVAAVSTLLAHGAKVDDKNKAGQTALMFAAAEGHAPILRLLLGAGADMHARTNTPAPRRGMNTGNGPAPPKTLNAEISGSSTAIVGAPNPNNGRPIIDVAASNVSPAPRAGGLTPLAFAVREGQLEAVKMLIEAGGDPNEKLPDGSSMLLLATINANYELAMFLVEKGADPNGAENGWTALHALAWVRHPNFGFNPPGPVTNGNMGSLEFARAMVAKGANINARITKEVTNGYRNALNRIGATPLLIAARVADPLLMRELLKLGADPKIPNEDNTTLLMVAAGVGVHSPGEDAGTDEEVLECTKIAMELGGDPNARDDNDETALHGAAYRGAPFVVRYLVEHGARSFDQKNIYGWTPIRIADGIYRTATYKESAPTAVVLRELKAKVEGGTAPAAQNPR